MIMSELAFIQTMSQDASLRLTPGCIIGTDISLGWSFFCSSKVAGIIAQFLGIVLTLALPRLWAAGCVLYHRGTSLQGQQTQVRNAGSFALDRIWNAGLPATRLTGDVLPPREPAKKIHDLNAAAIATVFFVVYIVLGTLTNLLIGNSVGPAASAGCSAHRPMNSSDSSNLVTEETRLQMAAASYAQSCYSGRGSFITGCNLFARQSLPYTLTEEVDCPFHGGMCLLGDSGAVRFTTGPVPAQVLGFNYGRHMEFERSTIFAPLVRNESFVKRAGDESLIGFDFYYGVSFPPQIAPVKLPWTYSWRGANRFPYDNTYGLE